MTHHRFSFDNHAKLDNPQRSTIQPPGPLIAAVLESRPSTVLDFGAGTGYFLLPLLKASPDLIGIAADIEPRYEPILTTRALDAGVEERLSFVALTSPPYPELGSGSMDAVILANVFHELEDSAGTLKECARILDPEGALFICDWDPAGSTEAGPPRDHRVSPLVVEQALRKCGLTSLTRLNLYKDLFVIKGERS